MGYWSEAPTQPVGDLGRKDEGDSVNWPSDYINKVICGDCLEVMRGIPDNSVDLVLTDPPYGINKAVWDKEVPEGYIEEAFRISQRVCVMPGLWAIGKCINEMGDNYKSIISGRNKNGMTYSPIGFGNWIPAVIGGKISPGQDAFDFIVDGEKPPHPSPKPLRYMRWLVNRLSNEDEIILDCFAGSGSTLVAAKQLGRKFIGIEIKPEYCKIAEQRLAQGILL